ncbi:hypothetical protein SEA_ATUIN_208 [Arthrobacter phage Atuin]|nr:hypothetical protein SEA_ATUIN_7 [Arthrobacter phage Atuin]
MPIAPDTIFDELEIDPKTGLPFLPEDLGWKIAAVPSYKGIVSVKMVAKSRRIPRRHTDEDYGWEDFHTSEEYCNANRAEITEAATKLYQTVLKDQKMQQQVNGLVGIYEPRR